MSKTPGPDCVVRFAPSPTGFLHIGGARTALFNWLFARHYGGKFRLRIEDTDRARSTEAAKAAIIDGLRWLGLDWDDAIVYQFAGAAHHGEIARRLLADGKAYHCYCTAEELTAMRAAARAEGRPVRYDGRWRDRDPGEAPKDIPPVIRLKAPQTGETIIRDHVQGDVRVGNEQLDDMILLRANGTPTYMLSVVVDDHDMGITQVIRGDDHLTNAARQIVLYRALGWQPPEFAHIPLIHGPDGAKLSKRHGALGIDAYRDMGYLPEALRNYLLRLGWAHGDAEFISTDEAVEWFTLDGVRRAAARFDFAKLENLNGRYIRLADDARLIVLLRPFLEKLAGSEPGEDAVKRLELAMPGLKERAKTLVELAENAFFCVAERPLDLDAKAQNLLKEETRNLLRRLHPVLANLAIWDAEVLSSAIRQFAESEGLKLGKVAQPLRAALTGRSVSPGIFDVLIALGKTESLARLDDQASGG